MQMGGKRAPLKSGETSENGQSGKNGFFGQKRRQLDWNKKQIVRRKEKGVEIGEYYICQIRHAIIWLQADENEIELKKSKLSRLLGK